MNFTKQDIVEKAREYLGTPFVHQGRLKGVGVDCGGLCICVLRDLGEQVADTPAYKRIPDGQFFADEVSRVFKMKMLKDIEPGDAIVFTFDKYPQHIGFVTGVNPLTIIHSFEKPGKVVEHIAGQYWEERIRGCFEYKKED